MYAANSLSILIVRSFLFSKARCLKALSVSADPPRKLMWRREWQWLTSFRIMASQHSGMSSSSNVARMEQPLPINPSASAHS